MKSWIKIKDEAIVHYTDGPQDLPIVEGWREVAYPATQWKLDAIGRVIRKSQVELDAEAEIISERKLADRIRIGTKIEAAISEAVDNANPVPLRNFLTKLVLRFRDLENELN